MSEFLCMSDDELALWLTQSTYAPAASPCLDCPIEFHLAEKAAGRCNGIPGGKGRPSLVTEDRREQWRQASRAWRRKKRLNLRNQRYRASLKAQVQAIRDARAGVPYE